MFGTLAVSSSKNPNSKWAATKKDWKVCMKWQQKHSDGRTCSLATADLYYEFGVPSCYLPRCEVGYYVDGTDPKFKMPTLFDRRALLGGTWRNDVSSYWNVADSSQNKEAWSYKGKPVLEWLFQNDDTSRKELGDAGWDESLIQLGTAMALGGYYHVKPCTATANCDGNPHCPDPKTVGCPCGSHCTANETATIEQQTPVNLGRQVVWDWVERMGSLINDEFFEWMYLKKLKPSDSNVKKKCADVPYQKCLDDRKKSVNDNWKTLKAWMEGGDFAESAYGTDGKKSSPGNKMLWLQYSARSYADQPGFT